MNDRSSVNDHLTSTYFCWRYKSYNTFLSFLVKWRWMLMRIIPADTHLRFKYLLFLGQFEMVKLRNTSACNTPGVFWDLGPHVLRSSANWQVYSCCNIYKILDKETFKFTFFFRIISHFSIILSFNALFTSLTCFVAIPARDTDVIARMESRR